MGSAAGPQTAKRRTPKPVEYNILLTATLCLLAAGAVMVYSASSARTLLETGGDGTGYLVKYLVYGAIGLVIMQTLARGGGMDFVRRITPGLLAISFVLLLAVKLPGIGVRINGAQRWIGAGPLQFQPSELMKLALVLYAAGLLAAHPARLRTLKGIASPLLVVFGAAILLIASQPDLGTALVIAFTLGALLLVAGVPMRLLGTLAAGGAALVVVFVLIEPYRAARLTAFLNPWAHSDSIGFQSVQGQIALGSGGFFGVGLGESVQKVFYLPEAHTDFILAVIGEEIGIAGVCGVLFLYGLIGYAGLRAAKAATTRFAQLLAAGLTALILCQALLNIFAVLGLAPLTGVPLPFISSGSSSLLVLLATMGMLLNVAARNEMHLAAIPNPGSRRHDAQGSRRAQSAHRGRWDGRARGARAGGRRAAEGGRG
ncbi:MAG: putative lipid II flippase FtsW [Solirubrobacteraceae bacterium]